MKKEKKQKYVSIGGQAVMEGVMMRGESVMATAVRDPEGIIRVESKRFTPVKKKSKIFRMPVIRGVINFFTSMATGVTTLMRSADVYGEGEPTKFESWLAKKLKVNLMSVVTTLSLIIGIGLSIFLFVFLPQFFTGLIIKPGIAYNFIEGGFRIAIFIIYLLLVSLLGDIRRVFMYHGAEHKTITCYEQGKELTVENAKTCSRLHNRCGTTFMFFVMIVSILVFSVANITSGVFFVRFLFKLALLPVVAGLSYELLKALAKTDSKLLMPLKAPGLLLQVITTSEPDDEMLEVAITAFNTVLEMQNNPEQPETKFVVSKKLSKALEETKNTLKEAGIDEESDAEWIVCLTLNISRDDLKEERIVSAKNIEKIEELARERAKGKPLWYIIGDTDFYGLKIKTDERALIPRPETELLAEKVVTAAFAGAAVLDLCTGSGAIAVAVKKNTDTVVTASDISKEALALAKENADLNGVEIELLESDLFDNIKGKFDIIVSNPPYIRTEDLQGLDKSIREYEPMTALDGGEDGLDFYRRIAADAPKRLNKNGVLFLECGEGQARGIAKLLEGGFTSVEIFKDYSDIERIVKATL